jgi:carbonic anhydrase/acetyltransferase-like protein (isoleucine patch superfamily)
MLNLTAFRLVVKPVAVLVARYRVPCTISLLAWSLPMPVYAFGERTPQFLGECWVADNATLLGSVILAHQSSIFFGAVLRGDNDVISIGEQSNVQDNAVLHTDPGIPLTLGSHVTVGHQAMLHGCSVGDGSLIGIGAVVLNRAVIGNHCLVGAGSLILEGKIFPDHSLIVGSPAKVVRQLNDEEVEGLRQGALHYVERWQNYRRILRLEDSLRPIP